MAIVSIINPKGDKCPEVEAKDVLLARILRPPNLGCILGSGLDNIKPQKILA